MKRINIRRKLSEALDSASKCSEEDSTAVVSLYNSWTASESGSLPPADEDDIGVNAVEQSPERLIGHPTLLDQLKKRCREEDLPAELKIRPRQRPNCVFLNYLGRSRERMRSRPGSTDVNIGTTHSSTSCPVSQDSFSQAEDLDPLLICDTQLPPIESYDCLDAVFLFDEL